jgi:hypothetical protein
VFFDETDEVDVYAAMNRTPTIFIYDKENIVDTIKRQIPRTECKKYQIAQIYELPSQWYAPLMYAKSDWFKRMSFEAMFRMTFRCQC